MHRLSLAHLLLFLTLAGCQQSIIVAAPGDGGTRIDWAACGAGDVCELAIPGCCAECGRATADGVVAVNARRREAQRREACPGTDDPIPCPACENLPNPFLTAECISGLCTVVDFEPAVAACNRDEDCRLRSPDCCECGGRNGEGEVVAIARRPEAEDAFANLVCPSDAIGCPECAPVYPDTVRAACVASRCAVEAAR